ncbi:hypothetical protein L6164_037487 [Bauhinia variegata]|uniref:Uncharacterized protein n=1 Tax=Bauhinia variegata TaxID=167791 RepID=A0ACB9KK45_BAUVA|nr:hypothetical protein L6164_037487 [Bauhinia variegata]
MSWREPYEFEDTSSWIKQIFWSNSPRNLHSEVSSSLGSFGNNLAGHIPKCFNQLQAMMIKNNSAYSGIYCEDKIGEWSSNDFYNSTFKRN